MLARHIDEIALAGLIEALDQQRARCLQLHQRRTAVKNELRLRGRLACSRAAKDSSRKLGGLVALQHHLAGIAGHLGAGNSSALHLALLDADRHNAGASYALAHAGAQVAQHNAVTGSELDSLSGLDIIHELHPRRRAHDVFHQRNLDRSRERGRHPGRKREDCNSNSYHRPHPMMEKPILTMPFYRLNPKAKDHGLSRECITAKEARSCPSRDQNPKLAFQGADLTHGFYLCPGPERLFAGMRRRGGTVHSSVIPRSRALRDLLTDKQANNRRNAQQADSVNPPLSAWDPSRRRRSPGEQHGPYLRSILPRPH